MHILNRRLIAPYGAIAAAALAVSATGALSTNVALADDQTRASAAIVGSALVVSGTNGPDAISLAATPTNMTVNYSGERPAQVFDRTAFTTISVALGSGDDMFTVDTQHQFNNIPLTVDGGNGNDFLRGSDGNDVLVGGRGDDDVDGGRGVDTEILGNGEDRALWVPGEGSDFIDGGRGPDSLVFIGSAGNEAFALQADGPAAVLTRDLGGIHMHMNQVEDVEVQALGGTDTIAVGDLSGTAVRLADLRLSGSGAADGTADGVLDTVAVQGTDGADHVAVGATGSTADITGLSSETRISGADTRDDLHISTGAGDDSVDVSDAATALLHISTDLGADQH